jgi:hypothetical protein
MNAMNLEYRSVELTNVGVLHVKVPQMVMAAIRAEVDQIQRDFSSAEAVNHNLAGNMEREYQISQSRSQLDPFIMAVTDVFQQRHPVRTQDTTQPTQLRLDNVWCNFQKATEFNPNHTHTGLLSFVIWVQVPYLIEEEQSQSPGRLSNKNNAGCFELIYNTTIGDLATTVFPADRTWEGQMLMFPARMTHCVYPFFTSQDYRISISGNVVADIR